MAREERAEAGGERDAATSIRVKGADGEWRELTVKPRRTVDPELDKLWAMSVDDFEKVVTDSEHPLHDKALDVQREAMRPIAEAVSELTEHFKDSFASLSTSALIESAMPRFDTKAWMPELDTSSWVSRMLPDVSTWAADAEALDQAETVQAPVAQIRDTWIPQVSSPAIDFDALEPPAASLAEIAEASEAKAHDIRVQQVDLLFGASGAIAC